MPRQRPGDRVCVCKHDKSMHRFLAASIGACTALDGTCNCEQFLSRSKARSQKQEAAFQAQLAAARAEIKKLGGGVKTHPKQKSSLKDRIKPKAYIWVDIENAPPMKLEISRKELARIKRIRHKPGAGQKGQY